MAGRPKKRVGRGTPWPKGFHSSRCTGSPTVLSKEETVVYKRYDKEIVERVVENTQLPLTQLAGLRLRPTTVDQNKDYKDIDTDVGSNDIVDLTKLIEAQSQAMTQHFHFATNKKKPATRHIPSLNLKKLKNQGFGVTIFYHCTQCSFRSSNFKLYQTTSTGACLTNVQAAVGLSKISSKSLDANFLFSTLNLNGPSTPTLQHHFSAVNKASSQVLEDALSRNRGVVHDYVNIQKSAADPVPSVAVAFDGQYDVPLYHGYDGKSNSVSEPVLEAETGLNLMISHAIVSKLDGSYEKDKVRIDHLRGG